MSESKNVSLVLLLNGFQVVRMVKLLRTFGMCGLYQRGGEIGKWLIRQQYIDFIGTFTLIFHKLTLP